MKKNNTMLQIIRSENQKNKQLLDQENYKDFDQDSVNNPYQKQIRLNYVNINKNFKRKANTHQSTRQIDFVKHFKFDFFIKQKTQSTSRKLQNDNQFFQSKNDLLLQNNQNQEELYKEQIIVKQNPIKSHQQQANSKQKISSNIFIQQKKPNTANLLRQQSAIYFGEQNKVQQKLNLNLVKYFKNHQQDNFIKGTDWNNENSQKLFQQQSQLGQQFDRYTDIVIKKLNSKDNQEMRLDQKLMSQSKLKKDILRIKKLDGNQQNIITFMKNKKNYSNDLIKKFNFNIRSSNNFKQQKKDSQYNQQFQELCDFSFTKDINSEDHDLFFYMKSIQN